jgi:microcystin-dependent protein
MRLDAPIRAIDAWPIGSVFTSIVATSPATLLGGGTWAAFGAGRVLVGRDSGDTDFDVAEETGGAKTITLDATQIPPHSHSFRRGNGGGGTDSAVDGNSANSMITDTDGGGGLSHSNVQPYIVVYFWKRTA